MKRQAYLPTFSCNLPRTVYVYSGTELFPIIKETVYQCAQVSASLPNKLVVILISLHRWMGLLIVTSKDFLVSAVSPLKSLLTPLRA